MMKSRIALAAIAAIALVPVPGADARVAADRSDNVKLVSNIALGGANDVVFTPDGYAVVAANGSGAQAGLWVVDVRNPKKPRAVGHLPCAGSGYDVGLWNDVAVMSIDSPSGNSTEEGGCNADGTAGTEGIRLVDISDRRRPREVKFVETQCGSHTNITFDHKGRGLVYVQSYPASTSGACPSAHGIISVVDITDPAKAEVVATPSVTPAVGCHDGAIDGDRAYMACLTEGQIWDISDPLEPEILSHLRDVPDAIWHSADTSNDGTTAIFGFESFGAGNSACNGSGEGKHGALYFYDVEDPAAPAQLGSFVPPRLVTGLCTAHNFSVIPGHDKLVTSWYSGGFMAVDFSDPAAPTEFGHFVAEGTSTWDAQWYRGKAFVGDTARGLDILKIGGLRKR